MAESPPGAWARGFAAKGITIWNRQAENFGGKQSPPFGKDDDEDDRASDATEEEADRAADGNDEEGDADADDAQRAASDIVAGDDADAGAME